MTLLPGRQLVGDTGLHEEPIRCRAGLRGVAHLRHHGAGDGRVERALQLGGDEVLEIVEGREADVIGVDAEKYFVVGMLWFGYPKVTPTQSRTATDDVTTELP